MNPPAWDLEAEMTELCQQGLWRELHTRGESQAIEWQSNGQPLLNFSSNDYLGLAASEALKSALLQGVERYGAGSGASRLVCGTLKAHADLEEALADFKGTEAALAFPSGYATSVGVLSALMGKGDTVILDKLCHASLVDGARLCGATIRIFPHNQLGKLERLLQTATGRVLVVTESIFSMDGDAAPLTEIVELKERYGAWLMVDEAHAVGVRGPQGRGLAAELGLEDRIDLHMGTLSKALGLSGGYLAGSRKVVDWLINRARSFIYTTAPLPALAYAALKSIEIVRSEEGQKLREKLWQNITLLSRSLPVSAPADSAILPWILGDEGRAMQVSQGLRDRGFLIPAIRYPTVGKGKARLRITVSAAHETVHLQRLTEAIQLAQKETSNV